MPGWLRTATMAALLLIAAPLSRAQTAEDACKVVGTPAPTVQPINIGRDAPVNHAVGPWIALATRHWSCTRKTDDDAIALTVQPMTTVTGAGGISAGSSAFNEGGDTYQLFLLASNGQQVGYIVRWRSRINGQTSNWQPLTQSVATQVVHAGVAVALPNGASYDAAIETQVRMVKTTAASPAASSSVNVMPVRAGWATQSLNAGGAGAVVQPAQNAALTANFLLVAATCVTPDVYVQLPPVVLSALPTVGSTGPATDFAMHFQNCPPWMHSIAWQAEAPGQASVTNGVLPLDAESTATGVSVQVLTPANTPLAFYTPHVLTDYDPTLTATYPVWLKARLMRTDNVATPGTVQASMNVSVTYK